MPLDFTGRTVPDVTGISIQATDSATGKPVVVKTSHEAIQDYGQPRVEAVASDVPGSYGASHELLGLALQSL